MRRAAASFFCLERGERAAPGALCRGCCFVVGPGTTLAPHKPSPTPQPASALFSFYGCCRRELRHGASAAMTGAGQTGHSCDSAPKPMGGLMARWRMVRQLFLFCWQAQTRRRDVAHATNYMLAGLSGAARSGHHAVCAGGRPGAAITRRPVKPTLAACVSLQRPSAAGALFCSSLCSGALGGGSVISCLQWKTRMSRAAQRAILPLLGHEMGRSIPNCLVGCIQMLSSELFWQACL